jgi:hypothetical protein
MVSHGPVHQRSLPNKDRQRAVMFTAPSSPPQQPQPCGYAADVVLREVLLMHHTVRPVACCCPPCCDPGGCGCRVVQSVCCGHDGLS